MLPQHTDKVLLLNFVRSSFNSPSSYPSDRHSEGRFRFLPDTKDIEAFQDRGVIAKSILRTATQTTSWRGNRTYVATLSFINTTTSTRSSLAVFVILDLFAVVRPNHEVEEPQPRATREPRSSVLNSKLLGAYCNVPFIDCK